MLQDTAVQQPGFMLLYLQTFLVHLVPTEKTHFTGPSFLILIKIKDNLENEFRLTFKCIKFEVTGKDLIMRADLKSGR